MTSAALDALAARYLGGAVGDHRAGCPLCAKPGKDDAVNVTIDADGSVVAHCHRCGENGVARPERVNGARRPAARARPTRAVEEFTALWESGVEPGEAFEHEYLTRKQVQAHGIRVVGDLLLVPMRNVAGGLVGTQKIDPEGGKLYVKGSRKVGALHMLGRPDRKIVIAEGYATSARIHEATEIATVIAFDAGNLIHVARAIKAKYATTTIVIAADDDIETAGNPGLTAATSAAQAIGCLLAVPDFGTGRPNGVSDFNDLALHRGPDAVRECIANAKAPEPSKSDDDIIVGGALTLALGMDDLEYVVRPILSKGQRGTLTGHPGHGKTTLAVGLLAAFAIDRPFGPLTPEASGLAYIVSAEDFQGTRNRILAEAVRLQLDREERDLLDARLRWVHVETSATPTAIKEAIERDALAQVVALIFVDTGPALFCGDDENDNVALRNFVEGFAVMAKLPGSPATVLAWHPAKGATADRLEPRGASAIKGSCDFNLTIWRDEDRVALGYTKIRGEHFEPIEGRLSTVELQAASGKRYFPPVVTLDEVDETRDERSDAREAREKILRQLLVARTDPPTVRDLATAVSISRTAVGRHLKHFAGSKPALVVLDAVSDRYSLTREGETRAKAIIEQGKQAFRNAHDPG